MQTNVFWSEFGFIFFDGRESVEWLPSPEIITDIIRNFDKTSGHEQRERE
jgi:hypothetical protein